MAQNSAIEWTGATWNPVTGCTKISAGCAHCYAERMALRLQAMGQANYVNGFRVTTHEDMLAAPLRWKKPQFVFVNSMSDLFHDDVPFAFIARVFDVMRRAEQHVFQVLTKRSRRTVDLSARLPWPANVWLGVTIEHQDCAYRADHLRQTPAQVKFLSLEPLLGPLTKLDLDDIDWVIAGGESGPGARAMDVAWVRELRDKCSLHGVPFFFKQWGGTNKKKAGRELDGRFYNELPAAYLASAQALAVSM